MRYWASPNLEVDFLLQRSDDYLAIEAKAARRIDPGFLAGQRAITDLQRLARRVVVYLGSLERITDDGIEIWPVEKLIERLADNTLWSGR